MLRRRPLAVGRRDAGRRIGRREWAQSRARHLALRFAAAEGRSTLALRRRRRLRDGLLARLWLVVIVVILIIVSIPRLVADATQAGLLLDSRTAEPVRTRCAKSARSAWRLPGSGGQAAGGVWRAASRLYGHRRHEYRRPGRQAPPMRPSGQRAGRPVHGMGISAPRLVAAILAISAVVGGASAAGAAALVSGLVGSAAVGRLLAPRGCFAPFGYAVGALTGENIPPPRHALPEVLELIVGHEGRPLERGSRVVDRRRMRLHHRRGAEATRSPRSGRGGGYGRTMGRTSTIATRWA